HALIREHVAHPVHSIKDLPTEPVEGLLLAAVPPRGPVEDVLILPEKEKGTPTSPRPFEDCIRDLEFVGTGSLRRRAQLRHYHSSINMVEIRGNVETRIQKLDAGNCDALVLAHAGIRRLGLEKRISYVIQPDIMMPAVSQGAVGIECRVNDKETRAILKIIDDLPTHLSVLAERSLLSTLRAGCHAPLGSLASIQNNHLHLQAVVLSPDGQQRLTAMDQIPVEPGNQAFESSAPHAINLGKSVARSLISEGAESLISMAKKQS
ncbi:MAG: hydroxymethylbilane synthase, partial [Planctomycetes bacterium]|nr:hydroxymethylbilane synthase [Planctomycetota bacterium]